MRRSTAFTLGLMAASLLAPAFANAVETGKPSLKTYLQMAVAALDECESHGFHVSVAVVDAQGIPIVMLHGDGSSPHSAESAQRKAYTAASFGVPSAKLRDLAGQNADIAGLASLDKVILVGGGMPIKRGDTVIGGIGVAGGVGPGQDEGCAKKGVGSE